jgi:5-formyltetrahydrofolate cyclo-ligase
MTEKHALRKKLLAMRKEMAPEEKAWRDKAIGERLLGWLEENPAASIGVYWPTQGEPDLTAIYRVLDERGVRLARRWWSGVMRRWCFMRGDRGIC